jgi:heme/copper-type cytochrome/quinol oxidase subunit 3
VALVATAPLLLLAVRAARSARRWRAVQWIGVATIVQVLYLAAQVLLFRHDLNDFTPQGSAYGSIYFTLLAAHHAHVLLGILLDLTVMWKLSTGGLDNYWLIGTRGLALYWYVVCALAVVVILTVLSPSL